MFISELLLITFLQSLKYELLGKVSSPKQRRPWKPVTMRAAKSIEVVMFLGERNFVYNLLKVEDSQREGVSFEPLDPSSFHNLS